jgi:hypothetical protein
VAASSRSPRASQPFAAASFRQTVAYSRDSQNAIRAARASSPWRLKPAYARSRCTTAPSAQPPERAAERVENLGRFVPGREGGLECLARAALVRAGERGETIGRAEVRIRLPQPV